jgi:hypothetical protein
MNNMLEQIGVQICTLNNMLDQLGSAKLRSEQYQLVKDDPHLDDE